MSLPGLVSPLSSLEEIQRWSFAHARDHDEIDQALKAKGVEVHSVQLDPLPALSDTGTWLQRHQQKHFEMNTALQLDGGDLTAYDLSDRRSLLSFSGQNFAEHTSAHQALGL